MLIKGRCGFVIKEEMSAGDGMRAVTPGKWRSKKSGREVGSSSREVNCAEGMNRVHVNDPS